MTVYILKTQDKYELPLAVFDNIKDLAKAAGVKPETVNTMLSRTENGTLCHCNYERVVLDE